MVEVIAPMNAMSRWLKMLGCHHSEARIALECFEYAAYDRRAPHESLKQILAPIFPSRRIIRALTVQMEHEIVTIINVSKTDQFRRNITPAIRRDAHLYPSSLPVAERSLNSLFLVGVRCSNEDVDFAWDVPHISPEL